MIMVIFMNRLIGKKIQAILDREHLTHADLAKMINKSQPTVTKITKGDYNLSINLLVEIADSLQVSVSYFIEEQISQQDFKGAPQEQTLINFMVDEKKSNYFKFVKCLSQNPSPDVSSPIRIEGNSGVGKTHLLKAIAGSLSCLYPNVHLLLIGMQDIHSQIQRAKKENVLYEIRKKYCEADVLLIDNVERLIQFPEIEDEVSIIIENRAKAGDEKLTILALDKSKCEIKLSKSLKDIIEMGMQIELPDLSFEVIERILTIKSEEYKLDLSQRELIALTKKCENGYHIKRELSRLLKEKRFGHEQEYNS